MPRFGGSRTKPVWWWKKLKRKPQKHRTGVRVRKREGGARGFTKAHDFLCREIGVFERCFADKSAASRASHFRKWREFAEEKALDKPFSVEDLHAYLHWLIHDADISGRSCRSYIGTTIDQLVETESLKQSPLLERRPENVIRAARTKSVGEPVFKAIPLSGESIKGLDREDRRSALAWLNSGVRECTFRSWQEDHMTESSEIGLVNIVSIAKVNPQKYSFTCTTDAKFVYEGDYRERKGRSWCGRLTRALGCTGHSARRGLSIYIRHCLEEIGYTQLKNVPAEIQARILRVLGWKSTLRSFGEYSADYRNWGGKHLFPISKCVHFQIFRSLSAPKWEEYVIRH